MKTIDGFPIWGDPVDAGALAQIKLCAETADYVAMMGDHHLGYSVPIGGVVAYHDSISPSAVGYDIGCGNLAVRTDMFLEDIAPGQLRIIMDDIFSQISFGVGRKNDTPVEHELFDESHAAWQIPAVAALRDRALAQLGTVGSGNHYVDLLVDEHYQVWVGCHFGSRGFGHGIATHYLKAGGAKDGINVAPLVLKVDSGLGSEYLEAMQLAGKYAYAGRDWVCQKVLEILGARSTFQVHNHHNYAWRETHFGREYWVVRKGATPAFPGQLGFVGGSMAENAVILKGRESAESPLALYSTVHGAGRAMSRSQAKKQISWDKVQLDMQQLGIELRGAGADEAAGAYKRLPEVLAHHSASIEIIHQLRPIGVAMAGAWEKDPFKD